MKIPNNNNNNNNNDNNNNNNSNNDFVVKKQCVCVIVCSQVTSTEYILNILSPCRVVGCRGRLSEWLLSFIIIARRQVPLCWRDLVMESLIITLTHAITKLNPLQKDP